MKNRIKTISDEMFFVYLGIGSSVFFGIIIGRLSWYIF